MQTITLYGKDYPERIQVIRNGKTFHLKYDHTQGQYVYAPKPIPNRRLSELFQMDVFMPPRRQETFSIPVSQLPRRSM